MREIHRRRMAVSTLCHRSERDTWKDVDKDINMVRTKSTNKIAQEDRGDLSLHICTSRLYNIYYNLQIQHCPELF
jgi:hypothetical protein